MAGRAVIREITAKGKPITWSGRGGSRTAARESLSCRHGAFADGTVASSTAAASSGRPRRAGIWRPTAGRRLRRRRENPFWTARSFDATSRPAHCRSRRDAQFPESANRGLQHRQCLVPYLTELVAHFEAHDTVSPQTCPPPWPGRLPCRFRARTPDERHAPDFKEVYDLLRDANPPRGNAMSALNQCRAGAGLLGRASGPGSALVGGPEIGVAGPHDCLALGTAAVIQNNVVVRAGRLRAWADGRSPRRTGRSRRPATHRRPSNQLRVPGPRPPVRRRPRLRRRRGHGECIHFQGNAAAGLGQRPGHASKSNKDGRRPPARRPGEPCDQRCAAEALAAALRADAQGGRSPEAPPRAL